MKVNLNNTVASELNSNKNKYSIEEKCTNRAFAKGKETNGKINLSKAINGSFSKMNVFFCVSAANKSSKKIDFCLDTFM